MDSDVRQEVVHFLMSELVGPAEGEFEVLEDPPNRRYLGGTLYPIQDPTAVIAGVVLQSDLEDEDDPIVEEESGPEESVATDAPLEASTRFLPSSLGMSFLTSADKVRVGISAGSYVTTEEAQPSATGHGRETRRWQREATRRDVTDVDADVRELPVLNGRAYLDVRWRRRGDGNLVTVTLSNSARETTTPVTRMWDQMLFQATFTVSMDSSALREYPSLAVDTADQEEEELRLQYRSQSTFAVGHGAAPEWAFEGETATITASTMPQTVVKGTLTELAPEHEVNPLAFDSTSMGDSGASRAGICAALDSMVDAYEKWSSSLPSDSKAGDRILTRVAHASTRMRDGIAILRTDDTAWLAFQLANRAMVLQYLQGTDDIAGIRRQRDNPADLSTLAAQPPQGRPWRPFQIGFFLQILAGMVDPKSPDRDTVDLIWFPTGGGKTEAYLLAASFEIFRRRLLDRDFGAGTAIVSRYTLSLLTAQQFQRATGTILACEMIRRERTDLGDHPISIGLWVGEQTTPNKFADARRIFGEERQKAEHDDVFIVDRCGWCGTEIMPRYYSEDQTLYGVTASSTAFSLRCVRLDCPFAQGLPVHVVDEALYEAVPSFVLGTVDKFADLAWHRRGGAFIGNAGQFAPPSLVVQDELHLLTGPLGTTAGIYEHSFEIACSRDGRPPKVVASTATVRRADEQVLGLFARDVAVYPPPGIDESDSFFARRDDEGPGRLYVGLMPQGHTSDTSIVHTLAALLQAPVSLRLEGKELDQFWTVVAYHSSLQELGRTMTIARDDVPLRLEARYGDERRQLLSDDVEELTANVSRSEQPRLLDRLSKSQQSGFAVSVLAATNMLSVGVDVGRLGLMLVNGQPKGTSEYIQATSRVGRRGPGLVVGVFRASRPRDRSHFENFTSYHSALYRQVEPTSVTPYSRPAQRRALHASLVILVRFTLGFSQNNDAEQVYPKHAAAVASCIDQLVAVVKRVDPAEEQSARELLENFAAGWQEGATTSDLRYADYSSPNQHPRLLKDFRTDGSGRDTLRSMRNVDAQTPLRIYGRTKN